MWWQAILRRLSQCHPTITNSYSYSWIWNQMFLPTHFEIQELWVIITTNTQTQLESFKEILKIDRRFPGLLDTLYITTDTEAQLTKIEITWYGRRLESEAGHILAVLVYRTEKSCKRILSNRRGICDSSKDARSSTNGRLVTKRKYRIGWRDCGAKPAWLSSTMIGYWKQGRRRLRLAEIKRRLRDRSRGVYEIGSNGEWVCRLITTEDSIICLREWKTWSCAGCRLKRRSDKRVRLKMK